MAKSKKFLDRNRTITGERKTHTREIVIVGMNRYGKEGRRIIQEGNTKTKI